MVCLPFLIKLKKEFPSKRILLTPTTYTGRKIAQERFAEADRIMYMPVDTNLCIRSAVNSLRPKLFISVETELWPALFHELKQTGSRILILNGRISNTSYRGYRRISFIMKKVLVNVDFFYMQTEKDAKRIIEIGADQDKVGVMGNFKFDIQINNNTGLGWQNNIKGKILLAASTHKGEEEIILDAYESIKKRAKNKGPCTASGTGEHITQTEDNPLHASDLKLIIAPRHPERFDEVAEVIEKRGRDNMRRSESIQPSAISSQPSAATGKEQQTTNNVFPDILLLDTTGELSRVLSDVEIAFIGGSHVPLGGHNIMEPAYWGKPIIFGPHMENFPIAREFLDSSAALEVKNSEETAETVIDLLSNTEKAEDTGQNAKAIIDRNTGAVNKAIELIRGFLGTV